MPTPPLPRPSAHRFVRAALLCFCSVLCLAACAGDDSSGNDGGAACADHNPLRNLYFGDLHVHTSFSFDSYSFDVRNTPRDAYRFARGETLSLPPLDESGNPTQSLRLDRPLDFAAVTDHAEFLGEVDICLSPPQSGSEATLCETYRNNGPLGQTLLGVTLTESAPQRNESICGADGARCLGAARSIWEEEIAAAEEFYDRSEQCAFTTLIAYEYTANTAASARHRNVLFRGSEIPFPTSYIEAPTPQQLWQALARDCSGDCDVLAIPHNANQSNGNTFALEYPGATDLAAERAQAARRAAIEPLLEIYQHKGDSECRNGLSGILGAPDELCGFEKLRGPDVEDCGDTPGSGGVANVGCLSRLDFARGALLAGLQERERLGVNPYPLGFVASTDTHNGTPGAVEETAFLGHRGNVDALVEDRLGGQAFRSGPIFSPGGLTAVWAEENSRDAIFAALRRREVYGTSGPRIPLRFFAGWDFADDLCDSPDLLATADANGVPMGATLPLPPAGAEAPSFALWATRDPGTSEHPGTPLQRLQIVKGWTDGGAAHIRVYEVGGDADNGAGVAADCTPTGGSGFDSLCAVWRDPDFSPAQNAFYYARVVENPSCRWTAWQCNAAANPESLASCIDPDLVRVLQERAWSSPIRFEPAGIASF